MNDCFGAVWSNLGAFLDVLRGLSASEAMDLSPEGGFCLSTRSRSASENWVWLQPDLVTQERAEAALRFFGDRGLPFVWPLPGDCEAAETLRAAGLKEAGQLEVMSLPPTPIRGRGGKELTFRTVRTREEALRWASVAWLAFGGEPPVPVSALNGAEAMADSPLRLGAAMAGEEAVGTFLLSPFAASLGVYYFAVLPGYRRRGAAMAMMGEVLRAAKELGTERIVLQATPAGVPFYRAAGFESHGAIPLFSNSDDVF
ncbi:GNAT family N-acetyltransferase [Fretibacterium fastidiosum]|uniref:Acetyltransferase (GNAT) family n=1 Tax=Fretibacterium fastidiosum TaxID=651822 RepID=A0AB94IV77_9BACT|nr:GNAT family N-acetyltransferase [Fretibacterium fastidiosum]CBL27643.1 Acetyltransferase (GNAT) family [Fretibacterium fastidiosum]